LAVDLAVPLVALVVRLPVLLVELPPGLLLVLLLVLVLVLPPGLLLVRVVQELRDCQSIKPRQTSCRSSPL
jgi:hypothetical protein